MDFNEKVKIISLIIEEHKSNYKYEIDKAAPAINFIVDNWKFQIDKSYTIVNVLSNEVVLNTQNFNDFINQVAKILNSKEDKQ